MGVEAGTSHPGILRFVESEVLRMAVPGGLSSELQFIPAEQLSGRDLEGRMLRLVRREGLKGHLGFFMRSRGNGGPGQPVGVPIELPNDDTENFIGVYIYHPEDFKNKDEKYIQKRLNAMRGVLKRAADMTPTGFDRHFSDGFLVVTKEVVANWKEKKRMFPLISEMDSSLHDPDRLLERKLIADQMGEEFMKSYMHVVLRGIAMLGVRPSELADDETRPIHVVGQAVNALLYPFIPEGYEHMREFVSKRDPICVFPGATVGGLRLDPCERPQPMGAYDAIHHMTHDISTRHSSANLHHVLPRKGFILEAITYIHRQGLPPDFDSRDLVMLMSYANHAEYLDVTKQDNAKIWKDVPGVMRFMGRYAPLIEMAMNAPNNIVRLCRPCHYDAIHFDTRYDMAVAKLLYEIDNGTVKVNDGGYGRGNVDALVRRVINREDVDKRMKKIEAFRWVQLARLFAINMGRLYVGPNMARRLHNIAEFRTAMAQDEFLRQQAWEIVERANGDATPELKRRLHSVLESEPYPQPERRLKMRDDPASTV